MTTTTLIKEPLTGLYDPSKTYNDFRDTLFTQGYCVIKNAIPQPRALSYQTSAHSWLSSFSQKLSLSDPATWKKENLPVQSSINTFKNYGVAHEKFMWDARQEPGVVDAFATIWGTDELLVSFDALNVTFPNRVDVERKKSWEHVDQSPYRRGLHCVQGIINLSEAGPDDGGLVVYPGSQKFVEEFFDTMTDRQEWERKDFFPFEKEQLKWFEEKGCKPLKVDADVGDLILWDSRTIHYGCEPSEASSTIRTVIYAAYTPAMLATPETLAIKKEVFEKWACTTHWPHENINVRPTTAFLEDGTVDPRNRAEPAEVPEMTDRLLRLAGVKAY